MRFSTMVLEFIVFWLLIVVLAGAAAFVVLMRSKRKHYRPYLDEQRYTPTEIERDDLDYEPQHRDKKGRFTK